MLPKQRVGIAELWAKLSEKRMEVGHINGWPAGMNGYVRQGNGVPGGGGGRRR
jgi:hypothetical protein